MIRVIGQGNVVVFAFDRTGIAVTEPGIRRIGSGGLYRIAVVLEIGGSRFVHFAFGRVKFRIATDELAGRRHISVQFTRIRHRL